MYVISGRNVHEILPEAIRMIQWNSVLRDSRNGPVRVAMTPVTTWYQRPVERVLYWPLRDANPFFHLFESLWMLAGRNDVAYPSSLVGSMANFSTNGLTYHGAYGYRWRQVFGFDQLALVVQRLKENQEDRRQVVQIYDATLDLAADQTVQKDIPCNLTVAFQVNHEAKLDMTVFNRSNDIIWGCYGANAVHFSILQEYMAARIGVPVGGYWQVSVNWHGYLKTLDPLLPLADEAADPLATRYSYPRSPYAAGLVQPMPLVQDPLAFDQEVQMFVDVGDQAMGYTEPFFRKVAIPMWRAYRAFQNKSDPARFENALDYLSPMPADNDWRLACRDWLERRAARQQRAQDDGVTYD